MRNFLFVLLAFIFLMNSTGCVSYSTLQTPKVLENNEVMVGLGATTDFETDENPVLEIYTRWAAFKDFDMGVKITGVPFAVGIIGWDIKYQALNIDSTFYVALDFGLSHSSGDFGKTIGYYPAVFIGNERFFGGAKVIIIDSEVDLFGKHKISGNVPVIFIGTSIGDNWRILPVANLLFSEDFDQSSFIFNLGIEYRF